MDSRPDLTDPQPSLCRAEGAALPKARAAGENSKPTGKIHPSGFQALLFSLPHSSRAWEGAAQLSETQETTRKPRHVGEDQDSLGREEEEQAGISLGLGAK